MSFLGAEAKCWIASPASAGSGSLPMPQGDSLLPSEPPRDAAGQWWPSWRGDHRLFSSAAAPPFAGGARHPSREVLPASPRCRPSRARLGTLAGNFCLVSAHGVDTDVLAPLLNHPSGFTTGEVDPRRHLREFCRAGLGDTPSDGGLQPLCPEEEVVTRHSQRDRPSLFPSLSALPRPAAKPSFRREFGSLASPTAPFCGEKSP